MREPHLDHPAAEAREEQLRGRTVIDADGHRVGTVRGVHSTDDDRVTELVVRERWFFGATRVVPTDGMHLEHGDVVLGAPVVGTRGALPADFRRSDTTSGAPVAAPVAAPSHRDPVSAVPTNTRGGANLRPITDDEMGPAATTAASAPAPVTDTSHVTVFDDTHPDNRVTPVPARVVPVDTGRVAEPTVAMLPSDALRARYGGLDTSASFVGTLVAFAVLFLVGGLLAAIADTTTLDLTTGRDTLGDLGLTAVLLGFGAVFVAYVVGGWSTGRMARFDGVANGLLLTVWSVVIAAVFGGLGAIFGDRFNVLDSSRFPSVDFGSFDLAGVGAVAIGVALMLVGGALGGAIGSAWHRRADRFLRRSQADGIVVER